MKYRFVLKDKGTNSQGWWLKISTIEELQDYYDKTQLGSQLSKGFRSVINCREFVSRRELESGQSIPLKPHVNTPGLAIGLYAVNRNISPVQATLDIGNMKYQAQLTEILNGRPIYINNMGGWHCGGSYSDYLDFDKLIFPSATKNKIKIERFDLGQHYYAFIDNVQVRDGDKLKWDTYEEAYNYAYNLLHSRDLDEDD